jgi:hypothetical protein
MSTLDPWHTGRPWQIARADCDLAHVFQPQSQFTFEPVINEDGVSGYTIAHTYQAPLAFCFGGSFLRPIGVRQANFKDITARTALPPYGQVSANDYDTVSEQMGTYMQQDGETQRLEGVIKIPCHAHAMPADGNNPDHIPLWINTTIHVYQFSNVVNGTLPLLVVRTPLSATCPANGNGIAIGWS